MHGCATHAHLDRLSAADIDMLNRQTLPRALYSTWEVAHASIRKQDNLSRRWAAAWQGPA
jgi:hypothetical protein